MGHPKWWKDTEASVELWKSQLEKQKMEPFVPFLRERPREELKIMTGLTTIQKYRY